MISTFNPYLKRVFIIFNIILAVTGCVASLIGVVGSIYQGKLGSNSWWLCLMAVITIMTPSLGARWAYKENTVMLKVYCGMMAVGGAGLLALGSAFVLQAPVLKDSVKNNMWDIKREVMSDQKLRDELNTIEMKWECCGVMGFRDWGRDVPQSCRCPTQLQLTGVCTDVPSSQHGTIYVYNKPCGPVILHYVDVAIKITLGLLFGFGVASLVTMLLCLVLFRVRYYPH